MTINKEDAQFVAELFQHENVVAVEPITGFSIGEIARLKIVTNVKPNTVNVVKQNPKTGTDFVVTVKVPTLDKLMNRGNSPKRVGAEETTSGDILTDPSRISRFIEDAEIADFMNHIMEYVFPWVCDDGSPLPDCDSCEFKNECKSAKESKETDDMQKPIKDSDDSSIYPNRMKTMDLKTGELYNNPEEKEASNIESSNIYIVTNITSSGEYTPSVFSTLEDAKEWLKECTIKNFLAAVDDETVLYNIDMKQGTGLTMAKYLDGLKIEVPLKNNENVYKILKDYNEIERFLWYIKSNVINGVSVTVSDGYTSSTIEYQDDSSNEMHIYKISRDKDLSIDRVPIKPQMTDSNLSSVTA